MMLGDKEFLDNNKITHIIRLTENNNILTYADTIKTHTFVVSDLEFESDKLHNLLPQIYNIIINIPQNENILVHCNVGMSRSPTVVIYYIMKKNKITTTDASNGSCNNYEQVLQYVKDKKSIVNPNVGFYNIMKLNENNLL